MIATTTSVNAIFRKQLGFATIKAVKHYRERTKTTALKNSTALCGCEWPIIASPLFIKFISQLGYNNILLFGLSGSQKLRIALRQRFHYLGIRKTKPQKNITTRDAPYTEIASKKINRFQASVQIMAYLLNPKPNSFYSGGRLFRFSQEKQTVLQCQRKRRQRCGKPMDYEINLIHHITH